MRNNRTLIYIFIFAVFGFPLIGYLTVFFNIEGGSISPIYRGGVLLILLLLTLFAATKYKLVINDASFKYLILFWIYYILKLAIDLYYYDLVPQMGYSTFSKSYYLIYSVLVCFLPMVLLRISFSRLVFDENVFQKVFLIYLVFINLAGLYYFLEDGGFYNLNRPRLAIQTVDARFIIGPTLLAVYAGLYFITLSYQKKISVFYAVFSIVPGILLIFAATKAPFLFLIVTLLIASHKRGGLLKKHAIPLFIGVVILLLILFAVDFNFFFTNRLRYSGDEDSTLIRLVLYSAFFEQFSLNPMFGTHFFILKYDAYMHNIILDIFLSTGIIGFFLILPTFRRVTKYLFLNNSFDSVFPAYLIYFFLIALTSGYIFGSNDLWMILGLVLAKQTNNNV